VVEYVLALLNLEREMIEWIDYNVAKNPPRNRALLAYCPDFSSMGYEVVVWNGANFEDEIWLQ
jgi:hypothetical protein